MVAVSVRAELVNTALESGTESVKLAVQASCMVDRGLNEGLHRASAMHGGGDLERAQLDHVEDGLELAFGAYFDDFLTEVVAELVRHHLREEVLHGVYKGSHEIGRAVLLEALLDHATALLVEGVLVDARDDVELLGAEAAASWRHEVHPEEG